MRKKGGEGGFFLVVVTFLYFVFKGEKGACHGAVFMNDSCCNILIFRE